MTVVATYVYMSSKVSLIESRVAEAKAEAAELQASLYERDAEISRLQDVHMYSAQMPIENLKISNRGGVLNVSGIIKNLGRRPVNDIVLLAFVVDENGTAISEFKHTAISPDGRPLYRWQQRRFRFEAQAPPGGKEVHVVITGIDFE